MTGRSGPPGRRRGLVHRPVGPCGGEVARDETAGRARVATVAEDASENARHRRHAAASDRTGWDQRVRIAYTKAAALGGSMFDFVKRLFRRNAGPQRPYSPEAKFVVTVNDTLVRCVRPNGDAEEVRWADLRAVIIETNDTGPVGNDFLWILVGTEGGCIVPAGAGGEARLLDALQHLPGFDNEAMIAASASVENRKFLCWEKA